MGLDPVKDLIPVRPAQHYTMGGVRTKPSGESPTLRGLFAAGEAACWDMHGFNRLGGNSVAETVVAGMIVGEAVADFCSSAAGDANIPTALVREFVEREQARLDAMVKRTSGEDASDIKREMQEVMSGKVAIFRTGPELDQAVDELQKLLVRSRHIALKANSPGANPELVTAYRVQKMLKLALCVAHGAQVRTESRGAHFRHDFPRRDDAQWLKRTLATWKDEYDTLPTLAYEALDVKRMELPPGWRGYGAKDYIEHPDTPARQAEVEAVRARLTGRGRLEVQRTLMPYEQLLPGHLRGPNERIDERFEEPLPKAAE
jgi:fumarate reductase flavoprotein subunit